MARPLLPNSYVKFNDGQLPRGPSPSGIFVFIGVSDGAATPGSIVSVNSPNDIKALFGVGPLARDLGAFFLSGAGFAYAIPLASSVAGSIGAPVVGQFTGLTVAAASTVKGAWDIRGRVVVGGILGVAQVKFSLDGGRTWGNPQVLRAGANPVIGYGNFTPGIDVTPTAKTYVVDAALDGAVSTEEFSVVTVAPEVTKAAVLAAMDVAIRNPAFFFNAFHISHQESTPAATVSYVSDLSAALNLAADIWFKYVYAIAQSSILTTGASALTFAQTLRAGAASNRVQVVAMPAVVKTLGGQFVMNISGVIASRRALLSPQNDLGMVAAGQLTSIVDFAPGWSTSDVIALDQVQNTVTIRQHVGAAGFYPTNGWMTDPSSDYSADKFRMVADLVAADVRTAGIRFVKMDIDPLDVDGSAEPLLNACRGPLAVRRFRKEISNFELSIPAGQDLLTSKELIIEVSLVPIASADWIRFNVGFKSPFAGG